MKSQAIELPGVNTAIISVVRVVSCEQVFISGYLFASAIAGEANGYNSNKGCTTISGEVLKNTSCMCFCVLLPKLSRRVANRL